MAQINKRTRPPPKQKTPAPKQKKPVAKARRDKNSALVTELRSALLRADLINQAAGVGLWDMSVIAGDPVNPKNEFWWSDQFRSMLGYEGEKDFPNVLESWSSRLHEADKDRVLTAFAAHLTDRTGRTPYDIEYQLALKDGRYRWFRATGTTQRNPAGIPLRVAGALKDIHDEKQLSLSLQSAITRSDLINKASSVGLWDMSVIAGDPVNPKNEFWWSDQFRKMLGYEDEKDFPNVLESWSSRLHPQDKDRVLSAFAAHLTDRTGKTPYDIEYQLALKDGQHRWFRATGSTMRDASGVPLRVAGALKDVHDEKQLSLSLENTIIRSDLINQAAGVGLWDMSVIAGDPVNPKNEFWWSEQFRKMLGFTDEKDFPNVLESWSSRLHANDKDRVLTAFAAHLTDRTGKTPYDIEYQLALKNGSYRWFRATGATMRDPSGIPLRVAGALKNIHDEKETTLAMEKLVAAAAAGDLTQRLSTENVEGVAKTIGEKLNQLIESIADSFSTVKVAIEQVGQASSQLRATSQMMSQSSRELNEGVERSSCELSGVAEGVRANASSASMANQLVVQTSIAGRSGEEKMEEMNSAMNAISSSAAQIARIIKVIDEIAFQTNLLALNAAVEAARAGRHGKGFAVVAQEVRNLAERSASAAKETAELIEDSTVKVADGVKIAEATRSALREIVSNVTKVVDIAGEIAAASGEQSGALASVTGSMKQATVAAQAGSQQSTEVAAAADELSRQMKVLRGQMGKYKLGARKSRRLVGLPHGATPELVAQIVAVLRDRAVNENNVESVPANDDEDERSSLRPTGTDDPSVLVPLDSDERGFGDF